MPYAIFLSPLPLYCPQWPQTSSGKEQVEAEEVQIFMYGGNSATLIGRFAFSEYCEVRDKDGASAVQEKLLLNLDGKEEGKEEWGEKARYPRVLVLHVCADHRETQEKLVSDLILFFQPDEIIFAGLDEMILVWKERPEGKDRVSVLLEEPHDACFNRLIENFLATGEVRLLPSAASS